MLKTIEKVTRQRIVVEKVPTVADLRARRLELTRAALSELLESGDDLDPFRVVVDTLGDEHDVVQIALAAVRLAHEATGGAPEDEDDIPQVEAGPPRDRPAKGRDKGHRGGREPEGPTTRVFIGAGRTAGIRPQDLVGAITGESQLTGRQIGAIEIADRFALVEVPEAAADDVVRALRGSTIKGKKATVRRERFDARRPGGR
jgi:ATP-dependent RNA helicase DeaD